MPKKRRYLDEASQNPFPIGYDNNIYYSKNSLLPEVKINAKRPSWQYNLTDYDIARLKSGQISPETAKSIAQYRATGTSEYMKDVNKLAWLPNGAMVLAGGLSGAFANPYLLGAIGLGSAAQNIEDKNYKEAALDVGLSFLGPELKFLYKGIGKGVKAAKYLKNWRPRVPLDPERYYRIVGKVGDPIGDASESGVIRAGGANPKIQARFKEDEVVDLNTTFLKPHDYPMFAKGRPWQGSTARADKGKPYIIRSKKDTGPIVWQESNIDFRHKGHAGIFRPTINGNPNISPTKYFEYWEPKKLGYYRREFPVVENKAWSIEDVPGIQNAEIKHIGNFTKYTIGNDTYMIDNLGNIVSYRPNSLSDSFGELSLFKDNIENNIYKVKMTSPYADAENLEENVRQTLSKTIDKEKVKTFSENIQNMMPKGSKLSADFEGGVDRGGLSMDSFQWLTAQPKYGRGKLIADSNNPFHIWNAQTEKNKDLFTLYSKYTKSPTKENLNNYKGTLDDFLIKNGMPLSTVKDGKVLIAQPWLQYKDGGRIYIKSENRGKFTALKERTGHSASWFKENGTPAQKKMAVFALNARKWKH